MPDTVYHAEVWIIHSKRRVLLTDAPGVPVGNGHMEDVAFVGSWPMPEMGWGQAKDVAQEKAKAFGYAVECEAVCV